MKATRFMRQPFFVIGVEVTNDNMDAVANWCEGHVIKNGDKPLFVRVPVNRPTNKKQTEAYPGTWVMLSEQRGEKSFKVYTHEWLMKNFFVFEGEIPDAEIVEDTATEPGEAPSGGLNRIATNLRGLPSRIPGVTTSAHFHPVPS